MPGGGGGSGAAPPRTPACDRLLASLQDCVKKHPAQSDVVCAHLHRAAAWCLIRQACPEEGESSKGWRRVDERDMHVMYLTPPLPPRTCSACGLEDCVGTPPPRNARVPQGPPLVPERCREQGMRLEACLVAHQTEERGG